MFIDVITFSSLEWNDPWAWFSLATHEQVQTQTHVIKWKRNSPQTRAQSKSITNIPEWFKREVIWIQFISLAKHKQVW